MRNEFSWNINDTGRSFLSHSDSQSNASKHYGIPQQKKFPLDSRAHVISAIKFFNYASPVYRRQLASAIIRKIHEYGIKVDAPSGSDNLFYRYYKGGES